ncbi:YfhE family protein [Bacillus sp. FJAT-45350]|nr:YfhE family protein [Bacillus sp. FJAT-45350]
MESKKRRVKEEKKTLNKTQEVLYQHEFRAADRAARR